MRGEELDDFIAGEITRAQLLRRLGASGIAVSLPALLAACGGDGDDAAPSQPSQEVKKGGVLRVGIFQQVESTNPFTALTENSIRAFRYAYPSLVQYNSKLEQVPDFGTEWEQSSDGRTLTFRTVPDAKWSDGEPLTAADAAWTINTIVEFKDGATSFLASNLDSVTGAEATDPNTLVVSYKQPVGIALALYKLSQIHILPEHVWGEHAKGDGAGLKEFQNAPPAVSGGPFILKEHRRKEITLLERNPTYYGTPAHIDAFGMQFYDSPDAIIAALKNDDIDLADLFSTPAILSLEEDGFVVGNEPGSLFNDFIFNSNPKKPKNRELLDPQVREAIDHAIDRQQIVDVALQGAGAPGGSIVPEGLGEWHNDAVGVPSFDTDLANQILDDAGYARGSDGVRMAGDHKMEYEVLRWDELVAGDRTFQIIQTGLDEIGIKVRQKVLDGAGLFAAFTAPDNKYLDFDLGMWDWIHNPDPDFVLSVLTCAQWGAWSDTGYCDEEYDDLYSKQSTAVDDAERRDLIWQMQEKVADERPYLILVYLGMTSAHSPKWAGLTMTPFGFQLGRISTEPMTSVHQV